MTSSPGSPQANRLNNNRSFLQKRAAFLCAILVSDGKVTVSAGKGRGSKKSSVPPVMLEEFLRIANASVTYDTDALTKATADWGDLNATQYGQILASRARLAGMGGTYIL